MGLGARSKASTIKARRAKSMADAFELRVKGWSQRAIAKELGCSLGSVNGYLQQGVAEHPVEAIEAYRAVELAKLDDSERRLLEVIEAHIDAAKVVDPEVSAPAAKIVHDAENALSKVRTQRAKVLGLEAPKISEVTVEGKTSVTPAEARQVMRELFAGDVGPEESALSTIGFSDAEEDAPAE